MSRPLACQQCRKVYVKSDRREGPESAELGRRQAPTCHDERLLRDHKPRWAAVVKSAQVEAVRTLKLSIYTWEGLLDFVGLTAKSTDDPYRGKRMEKTMLRDLGLCAFSRGLGGMP